MTSVIVVGAGLSGLAAAFRLQQGGADVTVLEAESGPGGRVQTEAHRGYLVDTGPDALADSYTSYLQLVKDVGLSDSVAPTSEVMGLIRDGRLIDIDPSKPWLLPFTRVLSPGAKLRFALGYIKLRKAIHGVDSYELFRSAALDDPSVTAYEFAVRLFGVEVAEYLVDPMMRLTAGSGAREVSSLNVLGALGAWTGALLNLRGGLAALTNELASRLDVRYGSVVTEVGESDSRVTVDFSEDGEKQSLSADACIIGTMYHRGADVWPPLALASPQFGDKLRNVKLISVSLGYAVTTTSKAYPVLVPTKENPEALLIFFQHNKAPDRAPEGHSLITVYTDTTVTDGFIDLGDDQLELWAADIIEQLCPELAGRRDMCAVTRWPYAGYLADPGFWRRTRGLVTALPSRSRVIVAGDLFGAGSLESAVRSGDEAARRALISSTKGTPVS